MAGLTFPIIINSMYEIGGAVLFALIGIVLIEVVLYFVLVRGLKWSYGVPIMLLAPGAIGLLVMVVGPILYQFYLAFTNMSIRRFPTGNNPPDVGLEPFIANITRVFTGPVLQRRGFFPLLFTTIQWTFIQVAIHVSFGMVIALLLNRKMYLRGIYRALILLPWALPQVIVALTWRGEFNFQYGFVNIMLDRIGLDRIRWKSDPFWNFVSFHIVNGWLGVPFMMTILLGGLQSIDNNYYEAAEMDGAGPLAKFRHITIPLIQPVMTPAVILGIIWTFNQFNVPYFLNEQSIERNNILVTALFRSMTSYFQYGFAATLGFVIFLLLLGMAIAYIKITGFKVTGALNSGTLTMIGTGSAKKKVAEQIAFAEQREILEEEGE
ncbi:carbohydrate ABC transporter permease [Spirochaeta africana]|uniref:Permease component of ABC-type sugar transporter n=1 Tax=Spirochaeta africana (strain ATCC 700263 / DSM 8902 / Z-7692) TaxID=889378 RepID=H9UI88_SPIAZ|nr:sugar ABC transporter permease [Spirochaeta africana]AFG37231.1 permease component of ABC-type sugar transporter [Spirochaeta africana DSM 8902]